MAQTPATQYKATRKHRAKKKALIVAAKLASGCVDCGYNLRHEALQFDHVRGPKRFELSKGYFHSFEDILAEIAKCEVVCANCHAIRTADRRGPGIMDP